MLGKFQIPPPLIEIEKHEEFEVSEILNSRIIQRKLEYILFIGRDTTLVKGPGSLSPIFVMLHK
jgi:hypothetical protein